jgi:hypothetical protein
MITSAHPGGTPVRLPLNAIVDALGLVGQLIDKITPGYVPKTKPPAAKNAYRVVGEVDDYAESSVKLL